MKKMTYSVLLLILHLVLIAFHFHQLPTHTLLV